jgi:hypothetical protein
MGLMRLLLGCLLPMARAQNLGLDLRSSSALQVNQVLRSLYAKGDMVQLHEVAKQVVLQNSSEGTPGSVLQWVIVRSLTLQLQCCGI